ncbi:MAG: EAL domain-containing protein [Sinobacterium sp.]|nr:EAL domain-containing protein [Sinobacterium sp.]
MENKQPSMNESLYMVTLPCGSIRYLDDACVEYLGLHDRVELNDFEGVPEDTFNLAGNSNTSVLEDTSANSTQRWQELFPPEWQHPALKAVDVVCKKNQAASFEFDQGSLGKSLITIKPLRDSQSNIIALAWHGKPLVLRNYYKTAFESSVIAQWVVSLPPINLLLKTYNISSEKELRVHINSPSFIKKLRESFVIKSINDQTFILFDDEEKDFKHKFSQYLTAENLFKIAQIAIEGKEEGREDFFLVKEQDQALKNIWLSLSRPKESYSQKSNVLFFNALDVSALKKSERILEEREGFLSAVLKAIPDYLFVVDLETLQPIFKNKSLIANLGFDIPNDGNFLDFLQGTSHPDDKLTEEMLRSVRQRLSEGNIFETSLRLRDKKGDWKQLYFRCAAMEKDAGGAVLNAVIVARDITEILVAEKLIDEKQKQYQLLADNYNDAVIATDCSLNITFVSPSIIHVLGYTEEEFLQLNKPLNILGFAQKEAFLERVLNDAALSIIEEDYAEVIEVDISKVSGENIFAEVKISVLRDKNNHVEGMLFVVRDITQRKRYDQDRLLAAKVFEASTDGIYITDISGNIEQVNQSFCDITGHLSREIIGQKPSILGSGWHAGNFERDILPVIESTGCWSGELMSRRNDGEAFLASITISSIQNPKQKISGYITSFRDITEAKNSEEHVKKLAYFDPLTELPNRMLFHDRLFQAMQRGVRNRHYVAVLFLDLDGFKPVNDRYGHALGDKLLTQVAERLTGCVRGDDTVARLGGDEFAVILHSLKDRHLAESTAAKISKHIIKSISMSFDIQSESIKVGVSIGISLYPDDSIEQDSLLRYADIAMYHAKKSGKNQYQFFTHDMHTRDTKRQEMAEDIEGALERDEFVLAFQPKYRAKSLSLVGFEALLRWQHPNGQLLNPSSFLQSLKELGLGRDVGEMVFHKACSQLEILTEKGFAGSISVNVFPRHFKDGQLPRFVESLLSRYSFKPEQLIIEISETVLIDDPGFTFSCLSALKKIGVGIALDDFATGDLALQHLRRLPVDEIKLDRQFIRNIDKDKNQLQFVKTLINLAKGFDKRVCVEGIEKDIQLSLLIDTPIDQVQGYLMAKPMLKGELDDFIATQLTIDQVLRP